MCRCGTQVHFANVMMDLHSVSGTIMVHEGNWENECSCLDKMLHDFRCYMMLLTDDSVVKKSCKFAAKNVEFPLKSK